MLGIIGGSGLSSLFGHATQTSRPSAETPYGPPSGPLTMGQLGGREVAFLARHGESHRIPPHEVNYRANIWLLKERGVSKVLAVAAVGGIGPDFGPGCLAVPHQLIDYTWGRPSTFFEGPGKPVTHIDFTEPYSQSMRKEILEAALACDMRVVDGAVYAATQGPRLETAAEIDRLERDGADVVGMTAMPEAALARELGLDYAAIAVVANHAAGRGDSAHAISMEQIMQVLDGAMVKVRRIIEKMAAQ